MIKAPLASACSTMRLLLDESVPRRFRHDLTGHAVRTVVEIGFAAMHLRQNRGITIQCGLPLRYRSLDGEFRCRLYEGDEYITGHGRSWRDERHKPLGNDMNLHEIEYEALHLSGEERAALAQKRLLSLDSSSEAEIAGEWLAEAHRRARDLDDGLVESVPAEGARRKALSLIGNQPSKPANRIPHARLKGSVVYADDPFAPVVTDEEWEACANRTAGQIAGDPESFRR
jgi:hypothetical protein